MRDARDPDPTVLARRADVAHQYRDKHREIINEKSRLRMRQIREQIRQGSSELKLQHRIKAKLYRRTYRARRKQGLCRPRGPQQPPADGSTASDPDLSDAEEAVLQRRERPGRHEHDIVKAASQVRMRDEALWS
ncbi:hypothetical protein R3P38DRAFT_3219557 [Favolaschia claudopus]|uniref:Uncharacterized protein n=1 Tax=Favolaschia claudopus TaxID=2862362 RepID=A0AAW0A1P8_9AGAR